MDLAIIIITSLLSIFVLFILTKLMGNRQMSQLSMFDYVNGITIGSIAAEMATNLENPIFPLTAMVVYALVAIVFSYLTSHSLLVRKVVEGTPKILLYRGQLKKENFKKAKWDINEFLTQCRNLGYFNLDDIETAVLESNGKLSILPKTQKRPVTPEDMQLHPPKEELVTNLIVDGKVLFENLNYIGKNIHWLEKKIASFGLKHPSEIFLGVCDCHDKITIYKKESGSKQIQILE